jgi:hypothetical protein
VLPLAIVTLSAGSRPGMRSIAASRAGRSRSVYVSVTGVLVYVLLYQRPGCLTRGKVKGAGCWVGVSMETLNPEHQPEHPRPPYTGPVVVVDARFSRVWMRHHVGVIVAIALVVGSALVPRSLASAASSKMTPVSHQGATIRADNPGTAWHVDSGHRQGPVRHHRLARGEWSFVAEAPGFSPSRRAEHSTNRHTQPP